VIEKLTQEHFATVHLRKYRRLPQWVKPVAELCGERRQVFLIKRTPTPWAVASALGQVQTSRHLFDHLIRSVLSFYISDTLIDHGIECSPLFRIEASPAFRRQLFSVIQRRLTALKDVFLGRGNGWRRSSPRYPKEVANRA
jgi:hypothetical protein